MSAVPDDTIGDSVKKPARRNKIRVTISLDAHFGTRMRPGTPATYGASRVTVGDLNPDRMPKSWRRRVGGAIFWLAAEARLAVRGFSRI